MSLKLNLKSLVRAVLQVGGAVVGTGVIPVNASHTVTTILGFGAMLYGVLWGQVNAVKQNDTLNN